MEIENDDHPPIPAFVAAPALPQAVDHRAVANAFVRAHRAALVMAGLEPLRDRASVEAWRLRLLRIVLAMQDMGERNPEPVGQQIHIVEDDDCDVRIA